MKLINHAYYSTGDVATGSNLIPLSPAIISNAQGDQFMTLSYTPADKDSVIEVEVKAYLSNSAPANQLSAALFQDAIVDALACGSQEQANADGLVHVSFSHYMKSKNLTPIKLNVRAGASLAGKTTFNGKAGALVWGGLLKSHIIVREYKM